MSAKTACVRAALLLIGFVACSASLRSVSTVAQPATVPLPVDFPPPPAQVERVPADPGEPCAWQDGYYEWNGGSWRWMPGRWVLQTAGCDFAKLSVFWFDQGGKVRLVHRPAGYYRNQTGRAALCEPPPSCR
jgi:hypothetical protein